MKKTLLALVVLGVIFALAGCSTSYVVPYEERSTGVNAQTVLDEHMDAFVDDYLSLREGAADPDYYADVSGVEPIFVGYEIVAYNEELDEEENTLYVDLFYFNDEITASAETLEPVTEQPEVSSIYYANMRSGPDDPDADEAAALDAAKATLEEQFPAEELEGIVYGIKSYVFLYDRGDGTGVLLGQALDGEAGYSSEKLEFAEE